MSAPNPLQNIRQDIQSMHAYAIQESAGMVKLDAMENPFSLSPELQKALGERLGAVAINRYPGARIEDLKQALARYVDLPEGCALMLGNGSDELISLLAMGCDVPGASILAPLPGFVMYAMSAQLQGLAFHGVPLTANFALDEAAMLAAMRNADVNHDQIDYLNAHGTSTPLGDINESNAIKAALGDAARRTVVSSTKSMTGHLLGGAGGIESVFTVLALHHQKVPPTINLDHQDPECDLDYCANTARDMKIDIALKNNFGFGGTNGSLVFKRI